MMQENSERLAVLLHDMSRTYVDCQLVFDRALFNARDAIQKEALSDCRRSLRELGKYLDELKRLAARYGPPE